MTSLNTALIRLSIAIPLGAVALFWNGDFPLDKGSSLMTSAEARIGRPLTPMSYAGVARRTTRRAVAVGAAGAAAGGVYYGAPVVVAPSPGCVQEVDPYGRVYTRCY
jgi:hypothetical protein